MTKRLAALFAAISVLASAAQAVAVELPKNDYPTIARADYVFGCMQVNGQSRESLFRCSCSIDKISELLPYDAYEEAETVMSVVLKGGEKVAPLHYKPLQDKIKRLKKAQVEAELRCF
jgi:hypothetical protein